MSHPIVYYTDPAWILREDGIVDPSLAKLERNILGPDVEIRFGKVEESKYVLSGEHFLNQAVNATAICVYRARVTEELLDAAGTNLRVVGRQGSGTDNLNISLLNGRNIKWFNIPDYCMEEVVTHSLALALALERHVIPQHNCLIEGTFDTYAGGIPRRIQSCIAGILGFGKIASALTPRLKLLYRHVITHDPYVHKDRINSYGAESVSFDELLENSDILFVLCSLNSETQGIFDDGAFAKVRLGCKLVNTARGGIISPSALYNAIKTGRISGAAIDTFSPENPHDDYWWARVLSLQEVVVSSHRAFLSDVSEQSQRVRTAEEIKNNLIN